MLSGQDDKRKPNKTYVKRTTFEWKLRKLWQKIRLAYDREVMKKLHPRFIEWKMFTTCEVRLHILV